MIKQNSSSRFICLVHFTFFVNLSMMVFGCKEWTFSDIEFYHFTSATEMFYIRSFGVVRNLVSSKQLNGIPFPIPHENTRKTSFIIQSPTINFHFSSLNYPLLYRKPSHDVRPNSWQQNGEQRILNLHTLPLSELRRIVSLWNENEQKVQNQFLF